MSGGHNRVVNRTGFWTRNSGLGTQDLARRQSIHCSCLIRSVDGSCWTMSPESVGRSIRLMHSVPFRWLQPAAVTGLHKMYIHAARDLMRRHANRKWIRDLTQQSVIACRCGSRHWPLVLNSQIYLASHCLRDSWSQIDSAPSDAALNGRYCYMDRGCFRAFQGQRWTQTILVFDYTLWQTGKRWWVLCSKLAY